MKMIIKNGFFYMIIAFLTVSVKASDEESKWVMKGSRPQKASAFKNEDLPLSVNQEGLNWDPIRTRFHYGKSLPNQKQANDLAPSSKENEEMVIYKIDKNS